MMNIDTGMDAAEKLTEDTPAQRIVGKIRKQGYTIQQVFKLLDSDGDAVLTRKEIESNIQMIGLEITESEA